MSAYEELCTLARNASLLESIEAVLGWDERTYMPVAAGEYRAEQMTYLSGLVHRRRTDPRLAELLAQLVTSDLAKDPHSDAGTTIRQLKRDYDKRVKLPQDLVEELTRASVLGQQAWVKARAANDFASFAPHVEKLFALKRKQAHCLGFTTHPYDALLDDFEPGLTTAELRPLFAQLGDALVPLVTAAGDADQARNDGALLGTFGVDAQRIAVMNVLEEVGFDPEHWRLDPTLHPFAAGLAPSDIRLTTKYDESDFAVALYSALHEFGHGLYEAQVDQQLFRTTLDDPVSLGVHESQSRMWENIVGRSRSFCAWMHPRLAEWLPGTVDGLDASGLYRAVNTVQPSLIRTEADETTYNLHIVLRFELELALVEGRLGVDELPHAWNEGMHELLGVDVPDDAQGVLQDVHWGAGMVGYFPTYTLGNLMAAQLWEALADEIPDIEGAIEQGDFAPLRAWLGERVHAQGRRLPPPELLHRVTGQELAVEPFLRYLRGKLAGVGVLPPT
jgi:carboxypeptidase Taq